MKIKILKSESKSHLNQKSSHEPNEVNILKIFTLDLEGLSANNKLDRFLPELTATDKTIEE